MYLTRWNPWRELDEMNKQINRFLARSPDYPTGKAEEALTTSEWMPAVDITENDKEYLIKAELPEVRKEDVKITAKEGVLTISGERRADKEEKGKRFHRIERSYGTFVRTFSLPDDVEEKNLGAEYKDGMLFVHLPKSPAAKPRSIEVKVT